MPRTKHLEAFRTVLHLAWDEKTWASMAKDVPHMPREMPESSGRVDFSHFEPDGSRKRNRKSVHHVFILINLWDGDRTKRVGDTADLVGTIAHESAHVTQAVLQFIQEDGPDKDHRMSEVDAYLTGFVARWIWDTLP